MGSPSAPFSVPVALAASLLGGAARAQDRAAPAPLRPLVVPRQVYPDQARFDRPLLVAFTDRAPDTAYVVSQAGVVFAVPRDDDATERAVFLDLRPRVFQGEHWEEGLLGFAFDPDYAQSGHVWACFTEKMAQQVVEFGGDRRGKTRRRSVIARYDTAVGEGGARVADPDRELRVLVVPQPFPNHNGGTVVFGPDGMLYVALGDGGGQFDVWNNAQDLSVPYGKVLRLDVRGATAAAPYRVPADNPFVGRDGALGEIWCYGLRNPWRIAFDRATGDLWSGDVGQDDREEVDRLVKGGNYGWNWMEGTEVFRTRGERPDDLIAPVADYGRGDGISVTGGHVYRGALLPGLQGCYVYADFATFRIWAVREDRTGGAHEVREIGRAPSQVSSFAEEPSGELLITCFDGSVYRLEPPPAGN
ncbi:MAG: sorbosone dehydrogenase family protein [Planctomycetota bacterium]